MYSPQKSKLLAVKFYYLMRTDSYTAKNHEVTKRLTSLYPTCCHIL